MRALLLILAATACGPMLSQTGSPPDQHAGRKGKPRDVTSRTLADRSALATLQKSGRVLFADDFEDERSLKRYFEIRGSKDGRATLVHDKQRAHRGQGAIRFTAPARGQQASGSGASGWLGNAGHERVYFRRYIRLAPDYDQGNLNHTGGGLAGVATSGKWDGMGKAGIKPRGDDRFSVGFEPWRDWGRYPAPGYMFLYTYWMDMRRGGDGHFWGNMIQPTKQRRVVPKRGKWVCLEQMVKLNHVGRFDGEQAAWIDGRLYLHVTGMRWRSTSKLRIKRFDIGIYIHHAARSNTVWYDDVVLSTGYVGR